MPCVRKFIAHGRYVPNATSPPFMRLALRRGRATLFYCVHGDASILFLFYVPRLCAKLRRKRLSRKHPNVCVHARAGVAQKFTYGKHFAAIHRSQAVVAGINGPVVHCRQLAQPFPRRFVLQINRRVSWRRRVARWFRAPQTHNGTCCVVKRITSKSVFLKSSEVKSVSNCPMKWVLSKAAAADCVQLGIHVDTLCRRVRRRGVHRFTLKPNGATIKVLAGYRSILKVRASFKITETAAASAATLNVGATDILEAIDTGHKIGQVYVHNNLCVGLDNFNTIISISRWHTQSQNPAPHAI